MIKKNHSEQVLGKIISGNGNSMKTCKDLGLLGLDRESNASRCQALSASHTVLTVLKAPALADGFFITSIT